MTRPTLTRIHINRHVIASNRKHGTADPPISVVSGRRTLRGHAVTIEGPSTIVYSPAKPLACGATTWIETRAPVVLGGT